MKRVIALTILIVMMATCAQAEESNANHSDMMKMPRTFDLNPENGADSVERLGDHLDSPYFSHPDFYNMTSTDTLTILSHFQTFQQTGEWSCAVACTMMVLNWFDRLGDYNEQTLACFRPQRDNPEPTTLSELIAIFDGVGGFTCYSTIDAGDRIDEVFTLDYIRETLASGIPIMIGWNDWGGHWEIIIGYDDMGTELRQDDVLIIADPYDTTDHNQDGYGVLSAERFMNNFSFYFEFENGDPNEKCFLTAVPKD